MPASLVAAIEKILLFDEAACLTGWAVPVPGNVNCRALIRRIYPIENGRQFAHPVLNLFSINAGVP